MALAGLCNLFQLGGVIGVFFAFYHREACLAEALAAFKHDVVFVLLDVTAWEEYVELDCRRLLDHRAAFR